jgi:hypothetical protein
MTTDRRFCRFNRQPGNEAFGMPEVPPSGLCLSAFVILTSRERPTAVLMGKPNPEAPWDHIGAADPARVVRYARGWMLPASHLMMLEAPESAARRILDEQLGGATVSLEGPRVVSEVYVPKAFPGMSQHWDLEFLFRGSMPESSRPRSDAWTELAFIDTASTSVAEISRSHEEVLAQVGLPLRPA